MSLKMPSKKPARESYVRPVCWCQGPPKRNLMTALYVRVSSGNSRSFERIGSICPVCKKFQLDESE
jgi:hypothetical protein